MSIEVTARHIRVDAEVQDYARGKAQLIADEFPRVEYVHVILDQEKHRNIAEIVVQAKNHIRVEAETSSDSLRGAIDLTFDKAERQLRKQRDRVQDRASRKKYVEAARKRGVEAAQEKGAES